MATTAATRKRCRRKFLRYFPNGFRDATYLDWERNYKEHAHDRWMEELNQARFAKLLRSRQFDEITLTAVRIESRTNLLFSFEKMALRDAVRSPEGSRLFAEGLYEFLYGTGVFETWCAAVESLPRRQTRVLTWPLVTVFPFLAQPDRHIFLKPNVTRRAANNYAYDFFYQSKPNLETYQSLHDFAETVRGELADLKPRDMIDLQSFLWVQGSDEYPD